MFKVRKSYTYHREQITNPSCDLRLGLRIVIINIVHDVLYIALKNFAKGFDCMSADALVSFKSRDLRGTDVKGFNKGILADAFFFHCLP